MSATDEAREKLRDAKEEKLANQIGKKMQELEKAEKTVRHIQEDLEELQDKEIEDVELTSDESPFWD